MLRRPDKECAYSQVRAGPVGSSCMGGAAPVGFPSHLAIATLSLPGLLPQPLPYLVLCNHFFFPRFSICSAKVLLHTQSWLELHQGHSKKNTARISHLASGAVKELTAAQVGLLTVEVAHKRPKPY